MKRISIMVVILFMAFAMACKNSSEIPTPKGSGSNSSTTQSAPASSQSSTIAPGMNPPHGQPNHRCDIAVGAPLDSPPGKQPTPPASGGK